MPIWDKVKQELDRAGQVAQDAIDEGRIRLEAQRVHKLADRAARTLGWAVHRARVAGTPLDDAELARHSAKVSEYESEAARLEAQIVAIQQRWRTGANGATAAGASAAGAAAGTPDPIDPTPAAPASATTSPSPETATAPQVVEATLDSTIDDDPWRPNDRPPGSI